jgi:hypothetical protein
MTAPPHGQARLPLLGLARVELRPGAAGLAAVAGGRGARVRYRNLPIVAVKRPARPYKPATARRFTVGNAKAALDGPGRARNRP